METISTGSGHQPSAFWHPDLMQMYASFLSDFLTESILYVVDEKHGSKTPHTALTTAELKI